MIHTCMHLDVLSQSPELRETSARLLLELNGTASSQRAVALDTAVYERAMELFEAQWSAHTRRSVTAY